MTPWTKPELIEVNMSAEIGAYQPDDGPDFVDQRDAEVESTDDES